jgi:protein disulfide-isomerase A1
MMKITGLLLLISLSLVASADFPDEEGVLVLGEDNFDDAIKANEFLLVEFYAPWCGHCKKLAPEYAKAAQTLAKDTPPLYVAKVDTTVHKNLGSRFGIQGYPTLKFFVNGTPSEYNGGRTEKEIVSWLRKKTGPAFKTLTTVEEVENFKNNNEVAVVLFGEESDAFTKVARNNEDVVFGVASAQEVLDNYSVTKGNIVLFKKFDEGRNNFTGELTEESITSFVETNSAPLTMKFDEKCAQLIFGKATPGLFLYRDKNAENTAELDRIITSVAGKVKGLIQVVITDIKEGLETRLAEYIGITEADLPTVRIHDTSVDLKKYNFEGQITEQNISQFVEDWKAGKLRPHLKSEEIPATQEEAVYVLVGKAFDQVVMDPTKDVLVEFYAPWCGHCKSLAPIYEEVANNLKHNTNLIIAKMDATANEVESVSIQGFPTIKFWPANNKSNPIDFNGDRTVEGFTKFLAEHGATSVTAKEDL